MATGLPQFPSFDCDDLSNAGPRWKKWLSRFDVLVSAMDIRDRDTDKVRKKALLLHYMGNECYDIYETLKEDNDDFAAIRRKMTDYFVPKTNTEYEKYVFRNTRQSENENTDQFCTRLRKLAINCAFAEGTVDSEIKSQVVQGCTSSNLRKKALSKDMDLKTLLETAKAMEIAKTQVAAMESDIGCADTQTVNKVGKLPPHSKPSGSRSVSDERKYKRRATRVASHSHNKPAKQFCYNCGGEYPHPHDTPCPAKGRKCHKCNIYGHYARCCFKVKKPPKPQFVSSNSKSCPPRKSHANQVHVCQSNNHNESDSDYSLAVNNASSNFDKIPRTELQINGVKCEILIDSGATVNIIDQPTFNHINLNSVKQCSLTQANTKLYGYGSDKPLPLLGKFSCEVSSKHDKIATDFYVTEKSKGSLLSFKTASELNILHIVNGVHDKRDAMVQNIIEEYDDLFHGVGKLKDFQLKLNIDENVMPVHQKHRRIPFTTRSKVSDAIKKLYDDDICEDPVNTPTPWVSPIVVVPKPQNPDEVRICVDMRAPNCAIQRVKHPMPTVDELIHDLNGCQVFSKLDLNQGYHQIELHPDSRYITTFSTHLGLHRYKRLNFGVNAASEKFQQIIEQTLHGLEGVRNISDDIIVASRSDEEHEQHLRACLQRIKEKGLTLNKKKCKFFQSSINFFGNIFGEHGISPDPKKVNAIQNAPRPTDKHQVKSLLGMANYVQRFIPNLATIVKPIRELTKKDSAFLWNDECEEAFKRLKSNLTSDRVMSYFDQQLETELVVDASPMGLGAILTQVHILDNGMRDIRIVAYASRTLDDVESRYSQTEREALAARWGVEHFHLYLYGQRFTVVTDHKPLVSIFSNTQARPSPRIERWCLRLQQYNFNTVYRPGKDNPADYLSRHPTQSSCGRGKVVTEDYINFVCQNVCPKAVKLDDIIEETTKDATLQNVIQAMGNNTWYRYKQCEDMNIYQKLASELNVTADGVLLRGHRIVIPTSMQKNIVQIAHEGHQGLVKTKSLLRAKVWFPRMDAMVEETVKNCFACSAVQKDVRMQPLKMSPLPDRPWQCVSIDFSGPFPNGDYCLVVIDEYSRFPVVEIVTSTAANKVIPVLGEVFSMHGMPETVKSDNGPPFQSFEFRKFMEYCGIKHRKITPLWPRANAQAENFMKSLGKAIKTATVEQKSWRQEMYKFLRNYRATPHVTTGRAPAELLFGSNIHVRLPEIIVPTDDDDLRIRDRERKEKQKFYADRKNCVHNSDQVKIGDKVLMQQQQQNKTSPTYHTSPMEVTNVKGSMITAQNHALGSKTRNVSLFKKIANDTDVMETDKQLVDEDDNVSESFVAPRNERPKRSKSHPKRFDLI